MVVQNVPDLYYGPNGVNLGGLLAWEFLLFHFVEVRRWQDIRNHHSVDEVRGGCLWGRTSGLVVDNCDINRPHPGCSMGELW